MIDIRKMNKREFEDHRRVFRRNPAFYFELSHDNQYDEFNYILSCMVSENADINKRYGYYNPLQMRLEWYRTQKSLMAKPLWDKIRLSSYPHGLTAFAQPKVPLP